MKYLLIISIVINIILLLKIIAMRISIKELRVDYAERSSLHTNTLLRVSSRDKEICRLATTLNETMTQLRDSYNIYKHGNNEIKTTITNITHDLRTPLTAILGYLELCEDQEYDEATGRYLTIIKKRALHMKKLTEELFEYSILSTREISESKEDVFVNQVLEDCIMNLCPTLSEKGIEPVLNITRERIVRFLYPSYVERIISNLLNNAVKYSDGDLEISLSDSGTLKN